MMCESKWIWFNFNIPSIRLLKLEFKTDYCSECNNSDWSSILQIVDLMGLAELFILCWSDIVNVFCFFLQDHVTDLLTTMDASQVHFDIVSSLSFSTSNIRLGIVNYKQFIQKLWAPWAYLKSMVSWNNRLSQTVLTIVMLYCQNQGH